MAGAGWLGSAWPRSPAATLQIFHMKVAYNICVAASSPRTAPRLASTAHTPTSHIHSRYVQPTYRLGGKKYFVFAIKYFLIALNKSAPGPMSVSIPGWWWPGGAAGRAVTQIRARCGGRGGAARSCAQPGHQLASCAGVCPNNLIPAATFTFHLLSSHTHILQL